MTEQEKKWLEQRKNLCARCFSSFEGRPCFKYDSRLKRDCPEFDPRMCLSENVDFEDAAEFEARVQKRLMYQYEKAFHVKEVSGGFLPNRQTMLMFARIDVEQEMDKQ